MRFWYRSRLYFLYSNAKFNYNFWLHAKPVYENETYFLTKNRLGELENPVTKKRFKGYLFKGEMYLDNPGLKNIEPELLKFWRDRGWI